MGRLTDHRSTSPMVLWSEQEVADLVGLSRKSIYRMRMRGELGYVRGQGGSIWIPRESVERWIGTHYVPPHREPADNISYPSQLTRRRAGSENIVSLQQLEQDHRDRSAAA